VTISDLLTAAALYLAFVAVLFAGSMVLPGRAYFGVELADGRRRRYLLNGLGLLVVVLFMVGMLAAAAPWTLAVPYHLFIPLLVVANVFAFSLSAVLYRRGRCNLPVEERAGIGGLLRGCFYGAQLNPTWAGMDLKMFSYRPSLIGLLLLDFSFASAQYERYGYLTGRMMLFEFFCTLYVINYFQFEYGMLYTWDIIAERFGWGLVWGDYVLVPFFYCLPGVFLVDNLAPLPAWTTIVLTLTYALGFWLFRGANNQKHRVKLDPAARIWGRPAELLGGRLLISGFWGIGRKLNYTGELIIYLSFTLLCGFGSPVPYLLPTWLAGLLIHRAWRDDYRCRAKYGELWEAYCRQVKFRMVPFIY
jgi:Delta14-sterol reductase